MSVYNIKKTGLNGYVYDFSVDYDTIAADDILDIRKYSMKKNDKIKNCLDLLKIVSVVAITFFGCNSSKCVSKNNQECKKVRPEIIHVNSNEPLFYSDRVK